MPEENITSEEQSGASQLNARDPEEAVESVDQESTQDFHSLSGLSLDELNETLGKKFKDKETALKSLKDTFSYVGKKVEQVENELKSKGFISRNDLESVLFYRDNPEYEPYRDVVSAYAQKHGVSEKEAIQSELLSGLFAKAKQADSYNETQSVIQTNPRLVASKSSLDQARDMVNKTGKTHEVESLVAKAVLDAYGN